MNYQNTDDKEFYVMPLAKDVFPPGKILVNDELCTLYFNTALLELGNNEPPVLEIIEVMLSAFFEKPLSYLYRNHRGIGQQVQRALPSLSPEQRALVTDMVTNELSTSLWRFELVRNGVAIGEIFGIRRKADSKIEELLQVVPGTDQQFADANFAQLKSMTIGLACSKKGRAHIWLWPTSPELVSEFYAWLQAAGESWPLNLLPVTSY